MVLTPRALGAAMLVLALLASGCAPAPATPTRLAAAPTAASAPATATAHDVWQVAADKSGSITQTVSFTP